MLKSQIFLKINLNSFLNLSRFLFKKNKRTVQDMVKSKTYCIMINWYCDAFDIPDTLISALTLTEN